MGAGVGGGSNVIASPCGDWLTSRIKPAASKPTTTPKAIFHQPLKVELLKVESLIYFQAQAQALAGRIHMQNAHLYALAFPDLAAIMIRHSRVWGHF